MKINKDRTLYDLCRKYKYYYNACKSLKEVDGRFWNKHLMKAYKDAQEELDDVTRRIILLSISEFIHPHTSVNIETEAPYDLMTDMGRIGKYYKTRQLSTVTIVDNEFAKYVKELLFLCYNGDGFK